MRYGATDFRLFAVVQGPKHATETVLLVHDPLSTSYSFRAVLPRLVAAGVRVITFDWPGYGFSEALPLTVSVSAENDVNFLTSLLASTGTRAVHLVLQVPCIPIRPCSRLFNTDQMRDASGRGVYSCDALDRTKPRQSPQLDARWRFAFRACLIDFVAIPRILPVAFLLSSPDHDGLTLFVLCHLLLLVVMWYACSTVISLLPNSLAQLFALPWLRAHVAASMDSQLYQDYIFLVQALGKM